MAPIFDGTASTYGEPEASSASRRVEWLKDNARPIALLFVLGCEIVAALAWLAVKS